MGPVFVYVWFVCVCVYVWCLCVCVRLVFVCVYGYACAQRCVCIHM